MFQEVGSSQSITSNVARNSKKGGRENAFFIWWRGDNQWPLQELFLSNSEGRSRGVFTKATKHWVYQIILSFSKTKWLNLFFELFYVCWFWFLLYCIFMIHIPEAISHGQSICLACSDINLAQASSIHLWGLCKRVKLPELCLCLVCFCEDKTEVAGRPLGGWQHAKRDASSLRH